MYATCIHSNRVTFLQYSVKKQKDKAARLWMQVSKEKWFNVGGMGLPEQIQPNNFIAYSSS